MDFTEVTVYTSTAGVDTVAAVFDDLHIEGYVVEDAADFEAFLQDTEIYWDYVDEDLVQEKTHAKTCLKVYLTKDDTGETQLAALRERLAALHADDKAEKLGELTITTGTVRQEDWEWGWKQYFKPFPVGKKFVIKPSWEEYQAVDGRMILEIDPASSFGTGSHETTQLCITALEDKVHGGERLLDMGTGSGILAIAAAMLGAKVQAYVDIDENCLKCAKENAEKNHVDIGQGFHGDVLHNQKLAQDLGQGYEIITANIVADIIMHMRHLLYGKLSPKGVLICSGILSERADEVQNALIDTGFLVENRAQRGDWVQLTAVK